MFKNYLNMVPKPIGLLFTKIAIFTIIKPGKIDPFITPLAIVKQFIKHLAFIPEQPLKAKLQAQGLARVPKPYNNNI